jgi:hypothetical protein
LNTESENPITEFAELSARPLVDWNNAPSIRDLKLDFEGAKIEHDKHVLAVNQWLDNLHVRGSARVNVGKGRSRIVPRLIRKQAEWRYASLSEPFLSTRDLFNVYPVTFEDKARAYQNQLVLNNQFNTKLNKVKFINDYIQTAVNEGTVIVRVGWDYEEETVEVERPVVSFVPARTQDDLAMLQRAINQEPDLEPEWYEAAELSQQHAKPLVPEIIGTETIEEVRVIRNQPTAEVCDYRNVIIDPTCNGDIDKARFVIFSFETSLADLEKAGKYQNLHLINAENVNPLNDPDHAAASEDNQGFTFNDKARRKLVAYEYWGYWDIEGNGTLQPIVATWVGDVLIHMDHNPFPGQFLPFVVVPYLPVSRSIYGEPDGALLEDNQRIIGAVTRGMIDIMGRSANGQTGIRKDALDLTNKRKFLRGEDYEFNANIPDPRNAIYMHTYPEIPASAQIMLQLQNAEAESLTGVKAFHSGISGQALGDTATGIRGALDAASKRELHILRRLADGIIQIGRKFIAMNAEFLSEEEVVRITNEEFVTVNRDDLAGNFDLELTISTAEEDNQKAQELAFMLQTMGNNMDPSMSRMILADIARLRKMPELAKRIESFEPQPDPMLEMQRQLEIQKLQTEIAEIQARIRNLGTDSMLDQAKVETERAKAENLQSDTDLKNLDFVEQESGVKQERDLQKLNEQSRAQAKTKLIEYGLRAQEQSSNKPS